MGVKGLMRKVKGEVVPNVAISPSINKKVHGQSLSITSLTFLITSNEPAPLIVLKIVRYDLVILLSH